AIGEDRLIMALQAAQPPAALTVDAYVAPLGSGTNAEALGLCRKLRRQGLRVELGDESFRLKKSFEAAERAGARYIVICGENEVANNEFSVKNLSTGEQVSVARAELAFFIRNHGAKKTGGETIEPDDQQ